MSDPKVMDAMNVVMSAMGGGGGGMPGGFNFGGGPKPSA